MRPELSDRLVQQLHTIIDCERNRMEEMRGLLLKIHNSTVAHWYEIQQKVNELLCQWSEQEIAAARGNEDIAWFNRSFDNEFDIKLVRDGLYHERRYHVFHKNSGRQVLPPDGRFM